MTLLKIGREERETAYRSTLAVGAVNLPQQRDGQTRPKPDQATVNSLKRPLQLKSPRQTQPMREPANQLEVPSKALWRDKLKQLARLFVR